MKCVCILCKLWLVGWTMLRIVTPQIWRRKQRAEERIRGRKWVSLFTSLSYSFQADTDRLHQSLACSWSHMIGRYNYEKLHPPPPSVYTSSTQLTENTSENFKEREPELETWWVEPEPLRATWRCCWSISSLGWLPFLWQVNLTFRDKMFITCRYFWQKISLLNWIIFLFLPQGLNARKMRCLLNSTLRQFYPVNAALHPRIPSPSSGKKETKSMKQVFSCICFYKSLSLCFMYPYPNTHKSLISLPSPAFPSIPPSPSNWRLLFQLWWWW